MSFTGVGEIIHRNPLLPPHRVIPPSPTAPPNHNIPISKLHRAAPHRLDLRSSCRNTPDPQILSPSAGQPSPTVQQSNSSTPTSTSESECIPTSTSSSNPSSSPSPTMYYERSPSRIFQCDSNQNDGDDDDDDDEDDDYDNYDDNYDEEITSTHRNPAKPAVPY
ncbi:hypothetical protein EX30DRAFT_349452 [Ascodesmis nigricans]|uniref:Uncharacterized protein n=1 Tax=Ascodesmis nigricans TaxID=341454 RepID=A0A4S2MUW7_9PEZI|nr:hypothetical protein EX30DRAFT_349452 [Ascodesmis nigricans]